jgi:hypothetical protein
LADENNADMAELAFAALAEKYPQIFRSGRVASSVLAPAAVPMQ